VTTTREDIGETGIPQPNNNLWQVSFMSLKTCLSSSVGSHVLILGKLSVLSIADGIA